MAVLWYLLLWSFHAVRKDIYSVFRTAEGTHVAIHLLIIIILSPSLLLLVLVESGSYATQAGPELLNTGTSGVPRYTWSVWGWLHSGFQGQKASTNQMSYIPIPSATIFIASATI